MADERIHVCLYFISSHRMKDIDVTFLKQLSELVPIVPIVAKADTMTTFERNVHLINVKKRLLEIDLEVRSTLVLFSYRFLNAFFILYSFKSRKS